MGEAWRVRDTKFSREVAINPPPEAKLLASLNDNWIEEVRETGTGAVICSCESKN